MLPSDECKGRPADEQFVYEYQRLQYNKYAQILQVKSRAMVKALTRIEDLKSKHRMVKAELTFRIREIVGAALELHEIALQWERQVLRQFADAEAMQHRVKAQLMRLYWHRRCTQVRPELQVSLSVQPRENDGRMSTPAATPSHAPESLGIRGQHRDPNAVPSTSITRLGTVAAAEVPASTRPSRPIPSGSAVMDPLALLSRVTTSEAAAPHGAGSVASGSRDRSAGPHRSAVEPSGTAVLPLELLCRITDEDAPPKRDVMEVNGTEWAVEFPLRSPVPTSSIRGPVVLMPAGGTAGPGTPPAPTGAVLLLPSAPPSDAALRYAASIRAAAIVCGSDPDASSDAHAALLVLCAAPPPAPPPIPWCRTAHVDAQALSRGVPPDTPAVLHPPGAARARLATAALVRGCQLADPELMKTAVTAGADGAEGLHRACLGGGCAAAEVRALLDLLPRQTLGHLDAMALVTEAEGGVLSALLAQGLLNVGATHTIPARRLTWGLLHAAAQNRDVGIARSLVGANADPAAPAWHEGAQKGALYFAVCRARPEPPLVQYLLGAGAAVDTPALDEAARRQYWGVLLLLLDSAGPDVKARSVALWHACASADAEMVQQLLRRGCGADSKRPAPDRSPLHVACVREPGTAVALARLLLDGGAHVDVGYRCAWEDRGTRRVANRTPLFEACRVGNADLVRLLLERGARVDSSAEARFVWERHNEDLAVWCPASWVCERHHVQPMGCTALEVARIGGSPGIVDLLLGHWPLQRHLSQFAPNQGSTSGVH